MQHSVHKQIMIWRKKLIVMSSYYDKLSHLNEEYYSAMEKKAGNQMHI